MNERMILDALGESMRMLYSSVTVETGLRTLLKAAQAQQLNEDEIAREVKERR